MFLRIITLLLFLNYIFFASANVRFLPNTTYKYQYTGETNLGDTGKFKVKSEFSVIPLSTPATEKQSQLCRFVVAHYHLLIDHGGHDYLPSGMEQLDFSKWMSFSISHHGEVKGVFYRPGEQRDVILLKKAMLGALSSKLVISDQSLVTQQRWAYQVKEAAHEGTQTSIYQAEPHAEGVIFTKTRTSKLLEKADQSHVKTVHFSSKSRVPNTITVREHFVSPNEARKERSGLVTKLSQTEENSQAQADREMDMSLMRGSGSAKVKLISIDANTHEQSVKVPRKLKKDTLAVGKPSQTTVALNLILDDIHKNFTCVRNGIENRALSEGNRCFQTLYTLLKQLTIEDLEILTLAYLKPTNPAPVRTLFVDSLGAMGTKKSQRMLKKHVFLCPYPDQELIMHALAQFTSHKDPPTKDLLNIIEEMAFDKPYVFPDEQTTITVQNRATLTLGSMVKRMRTVDPAWWERIIARLHDRLGVHDPWHHRHIRSAMTRRDLKVYMHQKATDILALGNAAMESSFPIVTSYLNVSDSHILLRHSAVEAVGIFRHQQAANELLRVTLTEQESNVKGAALRSYKRHPLGGNIATVLGLAKGPNSNNVTAVEHKRVRRSLSDTIATIWQGFEFHLATPKIDWQKSVGGSKLGAEFGLIAQNELDIKISPMEGHLKVDVYDTAFVTVHLGFIKELDWDLFRAEVCFKGGMEYNLNIFKEFNFEEIKRIADLFTGKIQKIVSDVTTTVTNFRDLFTSFKGNKDLDPEAFVNNLISEIKKLPDKVINLRKTAKKIWQVASKYTDLHPVLDEAKNLVNHVKLVFNDIKTDVMSLYNAIVDAATVSVPWAWEEIKIAFKGILGAIKKLLRNPKTAVQNIGREVARISTAVKVVVDAKDKILNANFFVKDNRPYWFDLNRVMGDFLNQLGRVKSKFDETIQGLKGDANRVVNDVAKRLTGIDLATLKQQALQEIIDIIHGELYGPFNYLKTLLKPFQDAYEIFTGIVTNVREAWDLIIQGYQEVRTIIQMIFAPKVHKLFPRKFLESTSCGDGFWESTGGDRYPDPGVELNITADEELVSPFNGMIMQVDDNKAAIYPRDLNEVQVDITNVKLYPDVIDTEVGAGDPIGTVNAPIGCDDGHIHFSLRKRDTEDYIDPSRYMEKRKMNWPEWKETCDHYFLILLNEIKAEGCITDNDNDTQDETPPIDESPVEDLEIAPIETSRKKRSEKGNFIFDNLNNIGQELGLPDFKRITEIFNFDMNDITLGSILNFVEKAGLVKLKNSIMNIITKIQDLTNNEQCVSPSTLEDEELKKALEMQGKSTDGARTVLLSRYMENEKRCFGLGGKLPSFLHCQFDQECLSMTCCMDLKLFIFRHALVAYIRYDPCNKTLSMGLDQWHISIPVDIDGIAQVATVPVTKNINILNAIQMIVEYNVERQGDTLTSFKGLNGLSITDVPRQVSKMALQQSKAFPFFIGQEEPTIIDPRVLLYVSLKASWCSTMIEECMAQFDIYKEITIKMPTCHSPSERKRRSALPEMPHIPGLETFSGMKIGDFINMVDTSRLDDQLLTELTKNLREAFEEWLKEKMRELNILNLPKEFERFDLCLKGPPIVLGPFETRFFPPVTIEVPLGPVLLDFTFGASGHYGVVFSAKLCLLSMKGEAAVTPKIGISAFGFLSLSIKVFKAGLQLTAMILTSKFPAKAEVEFNKFPLDVKARMDLEMIPLIIYLHGRVEANYGFGTKVLINKLLFKYQTSPINKELFNYGDPEPDIKQPDFSVYSNGECTNCGERRRRSLADRVTSNCYVEQIAGRDYTDPAVNIELGIDDDRSEIQMSVCVGSFVGGCDEVNNEPLGGSSSILVTMMTTNIPLYFTVTAKDFMGLQTDATCYLANYDVTLPTGRVTTEFYTTSHPHIIRVSLLPVDETPITIHRASIGYGKTWYGTQIADWHPLSSAAIQSPSSNGLDSFTASRRGRLSARPFKVKIVQSVEQCASACLNNSPSKCLSFCFDNGGSGECELLSEVQGNGAELHKSRQFSYYERLGVEGVFHLRYNDLQLPHKTLVFVNVYLHNRLMYENIISSEGILVDLTPPNPGPLGNVTVDEFLHENCKNVLLPPLHDRCMLENTAPNHRRIVDGAGSSTIFNGFVSSTDTQYSRSNRLISANWAGIHDDESGILMYTWAAGTTICGEDIAPHTDPHQHLQNQTQWTHVGIAFPLYLTDGSHYVSMRAINDVEFGGPLALTLCLSVPYTVDTSAPTLEGLYDTTYDAENYLITTRFTARDNMSGIKMVEIALGRSKRDTTILEWTEIEHVDYVEYYFQIPDGTPTWVKIRATNNVDLLAVGHATEPLLVDNSPPVAGQVFDGEEPGKNRDFQASRSKYCANWESFHDPHSGISKLQFGLGTTPGHDDVIAFMDLPISTTIFCEEDKLVLHDKSVYYATVVAFNGAEKQLSVSASSNGVLVDRTNPTAGWVKDGKEINIDLEFSGSASTVSAHFGGFGDLESHLRKYDINVYKRIAGVTDEVTIHEEKNLPNTTDSIHMQHFNFKHGDYLRVEVNATNNAELSNSASSDGFIVDLTEPVVTTLVDGTDINQQQTYTISTTILSASWNMGDEESGIDHYQITAYQVQGDNRIKVYPLSSPWEQVSDKEKRFTTTDALQLSNGAKYSVTVTAVNGAGLTAAYNTPGVIVDSVSPQISWVRAGVLLDQREDLHDGYVIQTDTRGITGHWYGIDLQTGIKEYYVAVGTKPGGYDDISSFRNMGKSTSGYIGDLSLTLSDLDDDKLIYYVAVKAVDMAGHQSEVVISSPIRVVVGDVAGVVYIGPVPGQTLRYQSDKTTVTFNFQGFQCDQDGIEYYEWSLGTAPGMADVLPYSTYGLLKVDEGSGKGQAMAELITGQNYIVNVRAFTGAGNILESSSESFVVDATAPEINFLKVGLPLEDYLSAEDSVIYQKEQQWYTATWQVEENESELTETTYTFGSYPFARTPDPPAHVAGSYLPYGLVQASEPGLPNILTLHAKNLVELEGSAVATTVVVDTTPPEVGVVKCHGYLKVKSRLSCEWEGFVEQESDVAEFVFGVGNVKGDDSVYPFTTIDSSQREITDCDIDGGWKHGAVYYATVIAVNKVGLTTRAISNPIRVDDTPPVGGLVVELPDGVIASAVESNNAVFQCNDQDTCKDHDAICQRSLSQVNVGWEPFQDDETPMARYEVALGSSPGGSDIHPFTDVPEKQRMIAIKGLDLFNIRQVFASVRGTNAAGLASIVISNGVFISRISAGLAPIGESYVYDGHLSNIDLDYQNYNERISAHWNFGGDPCPIKSYQWAVYRMNRTPVVHTEMLPAGMTNAEADELELFDGETFYVEVRATNELDYSYSLQSDGITVRLEPLLPGVVRDGPTPGVDLHTQPSETTLSANWGGFGVHWHEEHSAVIGYPGADMGIGSHQVIHHYEVAIGTDRRYSETRDNIRPFVNVGLNQIFTAHNLQLVPITATYFVTVRAYAVNGEKAEVTSNGVKVGIEDNPPPIVDVEISSGQLYLPTWISSTSQISIFWQKFSFPAPIAHYRLGIGIKDDSLNGVTCEHFADDENTRSDLFSVQPLMKVGKDTFVKVQNINMAHGSAYKVAVIGTDLLGNCAMTSGEFSVDTSAPASGMVGAGPESEKDVLYVPTKTSMRAWWKDFKDAESGIESYEIALYYSSICDPETKILLADFVTVPSSERYYTFLNLQLSLEEVYYVELLANNPAGLQTQLVSPPIFLDINPPTEGTIQDGSNYQQDDVFQSSETEMKGVFMYRPLPDDTCPYITYAMDTLTPEWIEIEHDYLWSMDNSKQVAIAFLKEQIEESEDGLAITMTRDIREPRMFSGAVKTDVDVLHGGSYQFEIKAAPDLEAITSVVFWHGGNKTFGDIPFQDFYNYSLISGNGSFETEDPSSNSIPGYLAGYGFQLHPHMTYQENTLNYLVFWVWGPASGKSVSYSKTLLKFDPSEDWHVYTIVINRERDVNTWNLELHIDGKATLVIGGGTPQPIDTEIFMGVHNRYGWIPDVEDMFHPPETIALFRNLRFPPDPEELCRYGTPFRGGDQVIVDFQAGVGSQPGSTDIANYTEIKGFCIPCQPHCESPNCDTNCSIEDSQKLSFTLSGLNLEAEMYNDDLNETIPMTYFLTILARTGSGQQTVGSSNGIMIDPTGPIIANLSHIDIDVGQLDVTFQGSNTTIAVIWESQDLESKITHTWWSIGTTAKGSEIQNLTYIGTNESAVNDQLELEHNQIYYVTVICENGARTNSSKTSQGVTVWTVLPNVTGADINITYMSPVGNNSGFIPYQDNFTMTWDILGITKASVPYMAFSMGTDYTKDDIYPRRTFSYCNMGYLELTNRNGLWICGFLQIPLGSNDTSENMSPSEQLEEYFMEPGRTLYIILEVCNKVNRCIEVEINPVVISRPQDIITEQESDQTARIRMDINITDINRNVEIQTIDEQKRGTVIFGGYLTEGDLLEEYKSDASFDEFKPYIVDPQFTKNNTDDNIKQRNSSWHDVDFYLNTLPDAHINGPLSISAPFDTKNPGPGTPRLLTWCQDSEMWIDAGRTCLNSDIVRDINWDTGMFTVNVCDSHIRCNTSIHPSMIANMNNSDFTGPAAFSVACVLEEDNLPPIITSPEHVEMFEDEVEVMVYLSANEPNGDDYNFELIETDQTLGNVNLVQDGKLTYTPPKYHLGADIVYYRVVEQRMDEIPSLSTNGTLTVMVKPVSDHIELMLLVEGTNVMGSSYTLTFSVYGPVEGEQTPETIEAVVVAYSVYTSDSLQIMSEASSGGGTISTTQEIQNITLTEDTCDVSDEIFSSDWKQFVEFMKEGVDAVILPLSCNGSADALRRPTAKTLTMFTYVPPPDFYGEYVIKFVGQNLTGSVSSLLTVQISVLDGSALPDLTRSRTLIKGSSLVGLDDTEQAVIISDQDEVTMSWNLPEESSPQISSMSFGMGTEGNDTDIYPTTTFPYTNPGDLELSSNGLNINGEEQDPSSGKTKRSTRHKFFMEPGRTLLIHLKACNRAAKCVEVPTDPIIISRKQDKYTVVDENGEQLKLHIPEAHGEIAIETQLGQTRGAVLFGGPLTQEDLQSDYGSTMSNDFKPYVVDPDETINRTDTNLRILFWSGINFYLNTLLGLDISGPLRMTIPFNKSRFQSEEDLTPRLLIWCPISGRWVDAGNTCTDREGISDAYVIDWENGQFIVKICSTKSLCDSTDPQETRKKRELSGTGFVGPAAFGVAAVKKEDIPNLGSLQAVLITISAVATLSLIAIIAVIIYRKSKNKLSKVDPKVKPNDSVRRGMNQQPNGREFTNPVYDRTAVKHSTASLPEVVNGKTVSGQRGSHTKDKKSYRNGDMRPKSRTQLVSPAPGDQAQQTSVLRRVAP